MGDFHSGAEVWAERKEVVQSLYLPTLGPLSLYTCLRIDEGDSGQKTVSPGRSWQW